ncbi:MAG: FAD-dependent oxidoreductase [Thermodesulfobacteriota bacterium]
MEYVIEPERNIPVVADVELLVCGGGVAGIAAAISAAKVGAQVMLLEKYGFLGGLCTGSLVITVPPLDNGINIELAARLKAKGAYVPCRRSGPEVAYLEMYGIDPEVAKYEFMKWLQEQGINLLLHSYITDVLLEGNVIKGVITHSKAGRQAILAHLIVDATGDADIAALAGAPCRETKKPMTMMFNMAGVEVSKVMESFGNWSGIKKVVQEGIEKGELDFALGILPEFGSPGVYAEDLPGEGEINVWSGNLLGLSGLDPKDLTKAEIITREHVHRLANFLKKKVPGFEKSRVELTSIQVGVRATRNIIGTASPTLEETTSKKFTDTVVKAFNKPDWQLSELRLPYGCLVPQKIDNLLVAGRCISAAEQAMGLLRLIPICLLTGQAAGAAAALVLKQEVIPRNLDVSGLQKILEKQGMNLGL